MTAEPGHAESLFFTLLWVEPFLLAGETAIWQRKTIHSRAHTLLLFSHRLPGIEHKWWPRGTSSRIKATVELEFHWVFLIPNKRLLSESNCSASANLKCHRGPASYSAPIQLIKLSLENTENSLCECSTLQDESSWIYSLFCWMYWAVPLGHKHLLLTVPLSRAEHRLSWSGGSPHAGILSLTLPSGPLPYHTPTPLLKTRLRICKTRI